MNCSDVKIWLDNASDRAVQFPNKNIENHLSVCRNCSAKVDLVKQFAHFIDNQKEEVLSEGKTLEIIDKLVSDDVFQIASKQSGRFLLSRIAAVLIIAFGLLAGILAGHFLLSDDSEQSNPWSNEFTLLSENSEYSMFE